MGNPTLGAEVGRYVGNPLVGRVRVEGVGATDDGDGTAREPDIKVGLIPRSLIPEVVAADDRRDSGEGRNLDIGVGVVRRLGVRVDRVADDDGTRIPDVNTVSAAEIDRIADDEAPGPGCSRRDVDTVYPVAADRTVGDGRERPIDNDPVLGVINDGAMINPGIGPVALDTGLIVVNQRVFD